MKKFVILFCTGLLLGVASSASAKDDLFGIPDLRFGGYLKNATAMRLHDDNDLMKIVNTVNLRMVYEPKLRPIKFYFEVRPEYDGAFDMQHRGVGSDTGLEPENRGIGIGREAFTRKEFNLPGFFKEGNIRNNWQNDYMRRTFLLRELWGEVKIGNFDIKLGKQQVAWGKTDGLKLLDVLNPTDFREFILMNMEDSRIPIWMANIKYYFTPKHNLQFIWMPDYVANFQAPPGYIWTLNPVNATHQFATLPFIKVVSKEPANKLENSDIALRYEGSIGTSFDFTINYLHRWDQNNVFPKFDRIIGPPPGPGLPPLMLFTMEPERQNIFGFSFTNTIDKILGMQDLVMRGEFAYYRDRIMFLDEPGNPHPIQKNNVQAVIGFDKNVWFLNKAWLVSFQLFEDLITSYPEHRITSLGGGDKKRHEETFTALVSTDFWNQTLKPQVLYIHNLSQGDGQISPKVSYDITDTFNIAGGFNFYYGNDDDALGQMSSNDQVFAEIKWSF